MAKKTKSFPPQAKRLYFPMKAFPWNHLSVEIIAGLNFLNGPMAGVEDSKSRGFIPVFTNKRDAEREYPGERIHMMLIVHEGGS